MIKPLKSTEPWRLLSLFPIAILAVLSIIATGGGSDGDGGSGGGGGDVDPPLNILPTYNFFLTNLVGDALLTVSVGDMYTVSVDVAGLFPGSVDLGVDAANNVTFLSYIARQSARFDLTVSSIGESPLDGTFAVTVTEDMGAMVGDAPGSGAFSVVIPAETVVVSILGDFVQLSLNGGDPVDYTWDEFTDLIDDETQETWQRRAALAAGSFEFMLDLFFSVADTLDDLEAVTFNNPLVEVCDMFTGSPPEGVLAQGDTTVTWLGSGELSPGDDFDWQFNQCWTDSTYELLDGVVNLEDYTETIDSVTGTLFEIGFGGLSGEPGGVVFNLTIAETVEDQGVFTIPPDDVIIVTGGFAMIIQSP